MTDLTAFALVCSLTPSPEPSSSELMAQHILDQFAERGISTSSARMVDHNVAPGVQTDMGGGDEWPALRDRILEADIFVLSTPIWVGHPSSLAQRLMERLDADIAETDEEGRPIMAGKVAVVAVVGNEDGAHKTIADMMQGLNDVGFSLPAQGSTYWVGEAMHAVDFKDLDQVPDAVATTTAGVVRNAAHLATLLRRENFPVE
ncbi:flavodoxin family protein [Arthrobacter agilis]|uniref:flavodoxin family protein n=1 Tax=Arthrobacter agilis TaxID=37921 RepID=UPI000B363E1A|nr:NAD(P)H-dependent oxidoreductase [Arthrobacter agilis]OUM42337.1 NADPH-dependent oxidoreductase [Arthrobacter agilis]PPB45679.1 NADPH-dependent oxidoreductase [Arthrobacter agilis]TPV26340.1 flavodoxin family protein [Arthrobacter agilis]VDR30796.1 NADPH-dependent FMN reductase [Arthrobacter agilis]